MTDKLTVGEVLKPQGIRGELKIKPFTDDAEVFCAFSRVFVGDTPYKVLSVRTGGGGTHRYNLSDAVLLKDNHIGAAGGVRQAVEAARAHAPFTMKIEVETETLAQVAEAVEAGADIIMLDNMSDADMKKAVALIAGRALVEISGNVTAENVARLAGIGADVVSSGAVTHSAGILDLSLKHLRPAEEE